MEKPLRILGIDPGTTIAGYGLVEIRDKKPVILNMGTIIPGKFSDHYERLKYLHERALFLVKEYKPDVMALEAPFYGKNVQSMLKLGRGQGVIMAAALLHGIPIFEYAPLLVFGAPVRPGTNLGTRGTFSDVAATIAEAFSLAPPLQGESFLTEILQKR